MAFVNVKSFVFVSSPTEYILTTSLKVVITPTSFGCDYWLLTYCSMFIYNTKVNQLLVSINMDV